MKPLFEMLDIEPTSNLAIVTLAYHQKAWLLYPARHPNNPDAAAEFHALNEAYLQINSQDKLDAYCQEYLRANNASNNSDSTGVFAVDWFNSFFPTTPVPINLYPQTTIPQMFTPLWFAPKMLDEVVCLDDFTTLFQALTFDKGRCVDTLTDVKLKTIIFECSEDKLNLFLSLCHNSAQARIELIRDTPLSLMIKDVYTLGDFSHDYLIRLRRNNSTNLEKIEQFYHLIDNHDHLEALLRKVTTDDTALLMRSLIANHIFNKVPVEHFLNYIFYISSEKQAIIFDVMIQTGNFVNTAQTLAYILGHLHGSMNLHFSNEFVTGAPLFLQTLGDDKFCSLVQNKQDAISIASALGLGQLRFALSSKQLDVLLKNLVNIKKHVSSLKPNFELKGFSKANGIMGFNDNGSDPYNEWLLSLIGHSDSNIKEITFRLTARAAFEAKEWLLDCGAIGRCILEKLELLRKQSHSIFPIWWGSADKCERIILAVRELSRSRCTFVEAEQVPTPDILDNLFKTYDAAYFFINDQFYYASKSDNTLLPVETPSSDCCAVFMTENLNWRMEDDISTISLGPFNKGFIRILNKEKNLNKLIYIDKNINSFFPMRLEFVAPHQIEDYDRLVPHSQTPVLLEQSQLNKIQEMTHHQPLSPLHSLKGICTDEWLIDHGHLKQKTLKMITTITQHTHQPTPETRVWEAIGDANSPLYHALVQRLNYDKDPSKTMESVFKVFNNESGSHNHLSL